MFYVYHVCLSYNVYNTMFYNMFIIYIVYMYI